MGEYLQDKRKGKLGWTGTLPCIYTRRFECIGRTAHPQKPLVVAFYDTFMLTLPCVLKSAVGVPSNSNARHWLLVLLLLLPSRAGDKKERSARTPLGLSMLTQKHRV